MSSQAIDHDGLFKQLLETFFWEFMELFFPDVLEYLEPGVATFLQQEFFTDLIDGDHRLIDLLAQVRFRGQESYFLIHLESQSYEQETLPRRMFLYFSHLHQKHNIPVYPIVVLSYDSPRDIAPDCYEINFPDREVLWFNYTTIQLNRLNWRNFLKHDNPVAAALMSKMRIARKDRPKVKAECLRLLATLRLDSARTALVSGFVDTYLKLNKKEERTFQSEIVKMGLPEKEAVMQIVTSWMEQGIAQGEKTLVIRQLTRRVGELSETVKSQVEALPVSQIEELGEALLDFTHLDDLHTWLSTHPQPSQESQESDH